VRAVEVFVNERLQQISSALNRHDQELVLMLALLNISEELLDANKNCSEAAVVDKKVRGLLEKLHAV
jgi:cell division protein ZapA (FtsZ GTPase activity inhibitor)